MAYDQGLHCRHYIQEFQLNIVIKANQTPVLLEEDLFKGLCQKSQLGIKGLKVHWHDIKQTLIYNSNNK